MAKIALNLRYLCLSQHLQTLTKVSLGKNCLLEEPFHTLIYCANVNDANVNNDIAYKRKQCYTRKISPSIVLLQL